MRRTTLAVLYGGKSGEHEVSLRSGASVVKHIDRNVFGLVAIGIDRDGTWYLQPPVSEDFTGDVLTLERDADAVVSAVPGRGLFVRGKPLAADVVFPVLHGSFGEDGTVQGLLDLCGLPYVGPGQLSSAISMDKDVTKRLWSEAGLPVVPWVTLKPRDTDSANDEWSRRKTAILEKLGLPVFVKPASTGSSVGVSKVLRAEELDSALAEAFRYDTKVLVERGIDAREIECSVTGLLSEITAYTPGEIVPKAHAFYDYDAKYTDPDGAELVIPAMLPDTTLELVRETARRAFAAVEGEGMARVDFFVDRSSGELYLNEINTIPGFTSISMFPKMCEASGLPYPRLLERLIGIALERAAYRGKLRYER
jgi:D-alanine-D-alanine ligase